MAGRRNHAVGALPALQPGILLDPVNGKIAGMAEDRKHRTVAEEVDCVIAPLPGRDFAAIEAEDSVKLAPAEGHLACGDGRAQLAPAKRAGFDFADVHTAPPLSLELHDRAGRKRP